MEVDQVVTWLKQQMILRELKALAGKPRLSQRRMAQKRVGLLARLRTRLKCRK